MLAATSAASTPRPLHHNPAPEAATAPLPAETTGAVAALDVLGREARRQSVTTGATAIQLCAGWPRAATWCACLAPKRLLRSIWW